MSLLTANFKRNNNPMLYRLWIVLLLGVATPFLTAVAQTWSSVNFPGNMVYSADALAGKLYVASTAHGVYQFDGTNWNYLTDYNNSLNTPNKSKQAVKNIDNLLYFGAKDFNTIGEGIFHSYDGTAFSNFQNSRFPYNGSYKVNCIEKYNGVIYAAGQLRAPGTANTGYNIIKWNGTDWVGIPELSNISPFGEQNNPVSKLIVYDNRLFVIASKNVYHYNGTVWDSLNLGAFVSVYDAALFSNKLYISGSFTDGATFSHRIVAYDGTAITGISADYPIINRLFGDNTGLYAVVTMPHPSFQGDAHLVKYDGTAWSDVSLLANYNTGYIPGYEVYDYNIIFRFGNSLYAGGRFAKINNLQIQSLAKLDIASGISLKDAAIPGIFSLEQNYPNPFNPSTVIRFSLPFAVHAVLSLYDINGAKAAELFNRDFEPGSYSFVLNTSELNLASGIYYYRLQAGTFAESKKLILLK